MSDNEAIRTTLEDLIDVIHRQSKEVERIVTHLEGQTAPLDPPSELSIVVSELSELHNRVRRLNKLPQTESSR